MNVPPSPPRPNGRRIRLARPEDAPGIIAIYNEAVARGRATADLEPVSLESRRAWLDAHASGAYPLYVAEEGTALAGWLAFSAHRPGRAALRHTAEISYYVSRSFHRQGVATALLEHALAEAPRLGFRVVFAVLLASNEASRRFLEAQGFAEWGRLPGAAQIAGEAIDHLYWGRRLDP